MMTETIDSNLDDHSSKIFKRELNGSLLAAFLLFIFSEYFFSSIYMDMYKDYDPHTDVYLYLVGNVAITLGCAFLVSKLRQSRLLCLIGAVLLVVLNAVTYFSDSLTGYPISFLLSLSTGLVSLSLLQLLLVNTGFFGRAQKIILLTSTATRLFASLFYKVSYTLYSQINEGGLTLISCMMLAAIVIILIIDREEQPAKDLSDNNNRLWIGLFVPLILLMVIVQWVIYQDHRIYLYTYIFDHESKADLLFSFVGVLLTLGTLSLMIFYFSIKNQWVYIGAGGVLLLLLLLVFIQNPHGESDYGWFWMLLCAIGTNLAVFGLALWRYRYTNFSWFTVLISLNTVVELVVTFATEHMGLDLYHFFQK